MTQYLKSDRNPDGCSLEEMLSALAHDVLYRASALADDPRRETRTAVGNDLRILALLADARDLAEESSRVLEAGFAPPPPGPGVPIGSAAE